MRAKLLPLLTIVLVALCGVASAGPFKATVTFPDGLTPGQEVPVFADISGDLEGFKDVPVALTYEAGQNGVAQHVELGKIGGDLQGKLKPASGPAKVSLRLSNGGNNYASVAVLEPGQNSVEFEFDSGTPASRAYAPFVPVLLWLIGAAALGFYALRGLKPAF